LAQEPVIFVNAACLYEWIPSSCNGNALEYGSERKADPPSDHEDTSDPDGDFERPRDREYPTIETKDGKLREADCRIVENLGKIEGV
jgi:hypothetical protein